MADARSRAWIGMLAGILVAQTAVCSAAVPGLRVSENQRFLVGEGGGPVFYLGDAAWGVPQRLTVAESAEYFRDRAERGFTVVEIAAVAWRDQAPVTNRQARLPFESNRLARPVEAYFQDLDAVLAAAEAAGLYTALAPVWSAQPPGAPAGVWGGLTESELRGFGEFLGRRYRARAMIWVLDEPSMGEGAKARARVKALGEGLRRGDGGRHRLTVRSGVPGSSGPEYADEAWVEFNSVRGGTESGSNVALIAADRSRIPVKPVIDAEPGWETEPAAGRADGSGNAGWRMRTRAYGGIFAGAVGHVFGDGALLEFWRSGTGPGAAWRDMLGRPAAVETATLARLVKSRPWHRFVPEKGLAGVPTETGVEVMPALRTDDGACAMVYLATTNTVTVVLHRFPGSQVEARWFDPRTGSVTPAGTFPTFGPRKFDAPSQGPGNDWILVLDDVGKGFGPPGGDGKPARTKTP